MTNSTPSVTSRAGLVAGALAVTACGGPEPRRTSAPRESHGHPTTEAAPRPGAPGAGAATATGAEARTPTAPSPPAPAPPAPEPRNPFTGLFEPHAEDRRGGLGNGRRRDEAGVGRASSPEDATRRGPDVTMWVTDVAVSGGLEPAAAAPMIGRARSRVRACYHRALDAAPGLTGDVTARVELGTTGSAPAVTVTHVDDGVHDDDELLVCVTRTLGHLRFPVPSSSAVITMRFVPTIHP